MASLMVYLQLYVDYGVLVFGYFSWLGVIHSAHKAAGTCVAVVMSNDVSADTSNGQRNNAEPEQ